MKNSKKGFTIVELVVVIAVIAILAAVLIPNLSRLVNKANESKAMQEAKAAYESYLVTEDATTKKTPAESLDTINLCIKSGDYYFHVVKGQFDSTAIAEQSHSDSGFTAFEVESGKLTTSATDGK